MEVKHIMSKKMDFGDVRVEDVIKIILSFCVDDYDEHLKLFDYTHCIYQIQKLGEKGGKEK